MANQRGTTGTAGRGLAAYRTQLILALLLAAVVAVAAKIILSDQMAEALGAHIAAKTAGSEVFAAYGESLRTMAASALEEGSEAVHLAYRSYETEQVKAQVLERLEEEAETQEGGAAAASTPMTGGTATYAGSGGYYAGANVGSITIPRLGINNRPVYYSANYGSVYNITIGSHSQGYQMPGEGGTSLICGHNGAAFINLGAMQMGDTFTFATANGTFTYEVYSTTIVWDSVNNVAAWNAAVSGLPAETAILDTCYPFNTWPVPNRYLVYCRLISRS